MSKSQTNLYYNTHYNMFFFLSLSHTFIDSHYHTTANTQIILEQLKQQQTQTQLQIPYTHILFSTLQYITTATKAHKHTHTHTRKGHRTFPK